jgi:hypothetical protein
MERGSSSIVVDPDTNPIFWFDADPWDWTRISKHFEDLKEICTVCNQQRNRPLKSMNLQKLLRFNVIQIGSGLWFGSGPALSSSSGCGSGFGSGKMTGHGSAYLLAVTFPKNYHID